MTTRTHPDEILRLHVDAQGLVWTGWQGVRAFCTGQHGQAFLRHPVLRMTESVRILGTAGNAQLISQLFVKHVKRGFPRRIEVVRPMGFSAEPAEALQGLWQPGHIPWMSHTLTQPGYLSYSILAARQDRRAVRGGHPDVGLLRCHPAFPAISFLPQPNLEACFELVSLVVDPR